MGEGEDEDLLGRGGGHLEQRPENSNAVTENETCSFYLAAMENKAGARRTGNEASLTQNWNRKDWE